jgi:condensin complex subunit 3
MQSVRGQIPVLNCGIEHGIPQVFMTAYDLVSGMQDEPDQDEAMIDPYQFGLLFIDWTNPERTSDP